MLHSRRLLLLLTIGLTVLGLSRIAAQDATPISPPTETSVPTLSPTETPTDLPSETPLPTLTPTPLPTETPTPLPSPTASETAAETATETPTLAMSESPTATLTAEASLSSEASPTVTLTASPSETIVGSPSATASLTPTATPTAASDWKILFTDNFDTGQLMLWTLGQGWGLVPSETGQALQVNNSAEPVTFVYNTLGDAAVQMRVLLTSGTVRLSTRQSDVGVYSLLLDVNGQVSLLRGATVIGSAVALPTQPSTWRTIGLSVLGTNLSATIDGLVVITAQDATPLPSGTFSVAGINAGTLLMDEVSVSVPSNITALAAQKAQLATTPSPTIRPTFPGPSPTPNKSGLLSAQLITCTIAQGTVLGNDYAIVAGGTSSADPGDVCGLKKAIEIANNNVNIPVNIFLGTGTYALDVTQAVGGIIRIFGRGVENSIITQITDTNIIAGLMTINLSASVELHNVTFKSGLATNTSAGAVNGGAILMYSGILNVFDSKFETNAANQSGGALVIIAGTVNINRSIFIGNSAFSGGASSINSANITVNCSRFESNTASALGGGMYVAQAQGITMSPNNAFAGNNASDGRQIMNDALSATQLNASSNWFSIVPSSPEVSGNVNTTGYTIDPAQDPTSGFATNNYYGTNAIPPQAQFPCQMNKPEQALISEITTYGQSAFYPSTLGNGPGRTGTPKQWTIDELVQTVVSIQTTAQALNIHKYNQRNGTTASAKTLFSNVMGTLELLRVNNDFVLPGGDDCNGTSNASCTSNNNGTMAFYGQYYPTTNIDNIRLTVPHEFGHRFDNQSKAGYPNNRENWFSTRVDGQGIVITDCNVPSDWLKGDRVLGRDPSSPNSGEWERGKRGWGSSPPTNPPTGFQQAGATTISIPQANDQTTETNEATADMFLNWVYRRVTDLTSDPTTGNPCTGSNVPQDVGIWQGFRNILYDGTTRDPALSGNARYWWMEQQIQSIFSQHATWN